MVVIAKRIKKVKETFELPKFRLEKLLDHIQKCVDEAPAGIVGLVVDLFCGAGGTSEGIEQAKSRYGTKAFVTIAGINHDKKALYSQAKNHPLAYYSTEDIRVARLEYIVKIIEICKERWPQCPVFVWGSLECTNHSNAKGGMSRDADSRTLAWHIFRYLEILQPDGLWIENVKEFMEWGPLMEKVIMQKGKAKPITLREPVPEDQWETYYGNLMKKGFITSCKLDLPTKKSKVREIRPVWIPIKSLKGTYYKPWKEKVMTYGYHNQDWTLNAADFGVPQNRKRFFPIFMRHGVPITKPMPTHSKNASNDLKPHVPVKVCLDFETEGDSIFTPGKIKSPKSYERLYLGLIKFVAGGKKEFNFMLQANTGGSMSYSVEKPSRTVTCKGGNQSVVTAEYFLTKYMGNNEKTGVNAGKSVDDPSVTITTQGRIGLVKAERFLTKQFSTANNTKLHAGQSVEEPAPTIMTQRNSQLVEAQFLDVVYGNGTPYSVDRAAPTVRTKDGLQLVSPKFLLNYQGKSKANSVEQPAPTIMTQEKLALVGIKYFICNNYTSGGQNDAVEAPSASVTTNPKSRLVEVVPWIADPNFNNTGSSTEEPSPTIMASRKHRMLVTSHFGGHTSSVDKPSLTVIARQDKSPLSLLTVEENGNTLFAIPVYNTDLPIVIKIKEFMALYGIADIKIRMLMVKELLKIQSFRENYYLAPGSTDQKKWIGNAVPPLLARCIAESMYDGYITYIINSKKMRA